MPSNRGTHILLSFLLLRFQFRYWPMLVSKMLGRKASFSTLHYRLIESRESQALGLTLRQYSHVGTQARVYHFQNQDPDRAFAAIVRTLPKDDKGSPHILEHLACCGSKKYPIRDPFFNMIKRSVNSYMNAWTGDDFTAYPFASPNRTDWRNLYRVYLDMSLRPLLDTLDFRQEGWRLQVNDSGHQQLKGIVLNEMKGAYQDADRQMMVAANRELFRGTPYVYDCGGHPRDIVSLKYGELKSLYQHYYHPSNMAFYFYGQGPIEEELDFLHRQYLGQYADHSHLYTNFNPNPAPVQQKYLDIKTSTSECNSVSITYNLGQSGLLSSSEVSGLRLLVYILLDKNNALIYKEFVESGVAQTIGYSGLNEGKLTTFTVTLKGIFPEYTPQQFEEQFKSLLAKLIEQGLEQGRVKQYLHQLQVKLATPREVNGIKILEESVALMNHRQDFGLFLNPAPQAEEAARKLQDKAQLRSLISNHFLQNQKVVVLRQLMVEQLISEEEIKCPFEVPEGVILKSQKELRRRQQSKQDNSVLPSLKLEDLEQPSRRQAQLVRSIDKNGKVFRQHHISIEEDINFYRLVFNFDSVDEEFSRRVMLWTYAVNRSISTASYTASELTSRLSSHTAGFSVFTAPGQESEVNIIFEFSCLKRNIQIAFQLLSEMIVSPLFESEHTLNSFKAFANESIESMVQNPMEECLSEAGSCLSEAASRFNSYQQIKDSLSLIKKQDVQSLTYLSDRLLKATSILLIEHSNQAPLETPVIVETLMNVTGEKMSKAPWKQLSASKAVTHSYGVNFCSQQYPGPKYLSLDHAQVGLFLKLLQQEYLHPRIRQQGGAYGSGASVRSGSTISLSSYMDPNLLQTFQVFDQSIEDLLSHRSIEEQKLMEAKIMQFAEVDRVRPPQYHGLSQLLKKYSDEQLEEYREALKKATFEDTVRAGQKYLRKELSSRCVFGRECPEGFSNEKLKDYLI